MQMVNLFTDGSSKGTSDGPGGYAAIVKILDKDGSVTKVEEFTEGFKKTTNNRMELMGVICGLESLKEPSQVRIYSDSKYVVDAFNQNWIDKWLVNNWTTSTRTPVKNVDLWQRLLEVKKPHKCEFIWVKGHAGHPENERCDFLAQSSSNGVKFEKHEDGTLKEVKKVGTGTAETTAVKAVVEAETPEKTIRINGIAFKLDAEGNLSPCENEDPEKCKEVIEAYTKAFEGIKPLVSMLASVSNSIMTATLNDIFTGSVTIPSFSVEK